MSGLKSLWVGCYSAGPISDAGLKELVRRCRRATAARPVGVFAVTDFLAMRVMRALGGTGRTVGREVLLIGYDDLDAAAETDPPLTTVHQPFREEGRVAVAKILGTVYGRSEESAVIPVRLVVRETA